MNAQEARARAEGIQGERAKAQYEDIQNKIKKAAEENEFKCFYYETIIPAVNFKLKKEGFEIKTDWHRSEYLATISW